MIDIASLPKPTRAEAARFLGHATMGYNLAEVDNLVAVGYKAWFDSQFAIPNNKYIGHFDWLKAKKPWTDVSTEFLSFHFTDSCVRRMVEGGDGLRQKLTFALSQILVISITVDLGESRPQFIGAAYMDLLQQNAFGNYRTLLGEVSSSPVMARFLTFKGSKKADPVAGTSPDENYAREILQLFTLGVENLNIDGTRVYEAGSMVIREPYKRTHIAELAKMFTGWYEDPNYTGNNYREVYRSKLKSNPYERDDTPLNLGITTAAYCTDVSSLQATVPVNSNATTRLNATLDHIFLHSNVAPFIARQLIQRFVTSNPSPAYIARVAAAFNGNGKLPSVGGTKGDLKTVVQAILMDDSLFDANRRRVGELGSDAFGKVREPFSRLTHWARAFGATSRTSLWTTGLWNDSLADRGRLAQAPLMAPSVFNFYRPGYVPPKSATAIKRNPTTGVPDPSGKSMVAPELQITDEVTTVAYLNFMTRAIDGRLGVNGLGDITASYAAWLPKATNPAGLVADLALLLTADRLTAINRNRIISAISAMPSGTDDQRRMRVQAAVLLVMASPEYIVQK
ncbi:MAG: DUF1800 family protein [Rubrivivax sp.]|nr:MAG: DUF1800 family protein [Rubrivivax sp.]